jgi:pyridoxine kinase
VNILSIQSHVVYGRVGNSAAVFPLQRMGLEVWPVHTVQFSNHTGYGSSRGRVFDAALVREVLGGIEERGLLTQCDGVLSGYIGSAEIGDAILDAVARVKHANAAALYCCDPVIGDVGKGAFVSAGVAEFMRDKAVPASDIVTPNQFELEFLTGGACPTLTAAREAAGELHGRGPRVVLVTSLRTTETPENVVEMLASDASGQYRLPTPKLSGIFNGAGDLTSALFFAHYLQTRHAGEALSRAGSSVFGVLEKTSQRSAEALQIVAAQDEIAVPSRLFESERLT